MTTKNTKATNKLSKDQEIRRLKDALWSSRAQLAVAAINLESLIPGVGDFVGAQLRGEIVALRGEVERAEKVLLS